MRVETATAELPVPRRWSLQVLGRFRLTDAAGTEIALPGRLDRALLAILALHGQRLLPRLKLAGLLWPMVAEPLRSLSVSLNKLRNALGDSDGTIILRDSDPVVTNFGAMEIDALEFERAAAQGSPDALERAERIYAGELLEGFAVQGEEFENWLTVERSHLRDLLIDVLSRLQRLRAEAGEIDKAIETAQRLLQYDVLHEESHRLLMRLQQRAGRRWAALKVAHGCEEALRRENIEPEPETRRLIEEIRRSYEPPGLTVAVPLRTLQEDLPRTAEAHDSAPGRPEAVPSGPPADLPAEGSAGPTEPAPAPLAAPAVVSHHVSRGAHAAESAEPAPLPARRPPFEFKLRIGRLRLSIVVATLVIVVLSPSGYAFWRYWSIPWLAPNPIGTVIRWVKPVLPSQEPLRLAVLQFESQGHPEGETLARGLSGDIALALGRVAEIKDIEVIAGASAQTYGSNPPDLRTVARDLNVRYLLLGSVSQSGNQLRVQVQLIDANGRQVRGKSYGGTGGDIFLLQDQITFDVINWVYDAVTASAMQRMTMHGTRNLDAWLEANEALRLLRHLTPEDNAGARLLYTRAAALDPNYAGANEGLAWTHLLDAEFGWSSSTIQSLAEAQQLTDRAFHLDPTKPQLYSLRGHLNLLVRNFRQAVADGEHAVEAAPNDADAPALLAFTLTYTGEPKRAIALMHRAIELNPRYPAWYSWALGRALRLAGDPHGAIRTLEAGLPERPATIIPLVELVIAYREAGDNTMAAAMVAAIREKVPNFSVQAWARAQPYNDPAMTTHDAEILRAAGLPD